MKRKIKTLDDLAKIIPKQTFSVTGKPMEPINVVAIGELDELKKALESRSWHEAVRGNLINVTKAVYTGLLGKAYSAGPISPSYVKRRHFFVGFERPTQSDNFRRRHHMRIWKTYFRLNGRRIWIGTISYDRSAGVDGSGIIPTHHISPNLLWEEKFLAQSLGIKKPRFIRLSQARKALLSNGDDYEYDGRALVLELAEVPAPGAKIQNKKA